MPSRTRGGAFREPLQTCCVSATPGGGLYKVIFPSIMAPTYASAGGSATVGTGVSYIRSGALVTSPGANGKSTIYVPVTNPPNTVDKLTSATVECLGNGATVTELFVYFGNTPILDGIPADGSKDFTVTTTSTSSLPDSNPYGIDVSMDIEFTSTTSTFEVYSVTLKFGNSLRTTRILYVIQYHIEIATYGWAFDQVLLLIS
ncbi:hypothetical protein GGR50DRAFT_598825 [Xylaria sp. CBS 124048]|nr:hypothetical protein GGR50DRAFT_598825 [Xylaria sp. CBS 124048]